MLFIEFLVEQKITENVENTENELLKSAHFNMKELIYKKNIIKYL